MKISVLIILAALLIPLHAFPASAFSNNEKLVYDVSWTGVKAATSVHEVSTKGNEMHIVSTTRSNSWIDSFFKVDDRAESVITRGSGDRFGTPKYSRNKIQEGRHRRLKEAYFDPQELKVESRNLLEKSKRVDKISANTFDSLSCVYYVRTLELVPGRSVYVDIYDFNRLWNTEVKVLRREEINTPLGRFKTIVVKPMMKAEGYFSRTGDVTVWLTDDTLRIPVKMTTKVKIGKITATISGGSYWPANGDRTASN